MFKKKRTKIAERTLQIVSYQQALYRLDKKNDGKIQEYLSQLIDAILLLCKIINSK